jgi:hypothetical protein
MPLGQMPLGGQPSARSELPLAHLALDQCGHIRLGDPERAVRQRTGHVPTNRG